MKIVANNKKAFHDYHILDKFEAGIVLVGSEVKAIRASRVNLKDSFVKAIKGEIFLLNAHISHLSTANPHFKPDETRSRKLLLNKKEINKIIGKISKEGYTVVPLKIYFNDKNLAKVEVALAKGKDQGDKREAIKRKELDKEAQMAMKRFF